MRAEGKHDKEYIVTVDKPVTPAFVKAMSEGVKILGSMTLPCQVTRMSERTFRIVLNEGKNRQIRRMCSSFGYQVRKLKRVRIMNIELGQLPTGQWRDLTANELDVMFQTLQYRPQ